VWLATLWIALAALGDSDYEASIGENLAFLYDRSMLFITTFGALLGLVIDLAWRAAERWLGFRRWLSTRGLMLSGALAGHYWILHQLQLARWRELHR
jgi:hypothetical protein